MRKAVNLHVLGALICNVVDVEDRATVGHDPQAHLETALASPIGDDECRFPTLDHRPFKLLGDTSTFSFVDLEGLVELLADLGCGSTRPALDKLAAEQLFDPLVGDHEAALMVEKKKPARHIVKRGV